VILIRVVDNRIVVLHDFTHLTRVKPKRRECNVVHLQASHDSLVTVVRNIHAVEPLHARDGVEHVVATDSAPQSSIV